MRRKPYTPWTADEKLLLKCAYPETKPGDLVVLFGGKFDAKQINQKAKKLGVKKSAAYRAANGIDAAGKRIKGGTPWNKGIPYHAGGESIQTQFKKGHKLNQEFPLGYTRLTKDGYIEIKVRSRTQTQSGFVLKHREVWKQHHGEYPPRDRPLIFINGNKQDCRIENLRLATRAELMQMNTVHRLPAELRELIGLRIVLKRKIEGTYYGKQSSRNTNKSHRSDARISFVPRNKSVQQQTNNSGPRRIGR